MCRVQCVWCGVCLASRLLQQCLLFFSPNESLTGKRKKRENAVLVTKQTKKPKIRGSSQADTEWEGEDPTGRKCGQQRWLISVGGIDTHRQFVEAVGTAFTTRTRTRRIEKASAAVAVKGQSVCSEVHLHTVSSSSSSRTGHQVNCDRHLSTLSSACYSHLKPEKR